MALNLHFLIRELGVMPSWVLVKVKEVILY
jgi:hypothetical protein